MSAPLLVWDPRMLGYDLGGDHPLHPLRWELTWALAQSLGVTEDYRVVAAEVADDEALGRVHTVGYINAVRRASASDGYLVAVGHGLGTPDNPIFPGMHENAALIAGASIACAQAIAHREVDRAVNFCGGLHHAMPDNASGFCVYNDVALGITALLDAGVRKVAYVDVDAHHGDGVQAAFYDDPRVLTISVHQSPLSLFPGTGFAAETGHGEAHGTSVNLGLPAGTSDSSWLRAFHAVVPGLVRAFRPEVLVTQHGADSHREDPLADLNLSVDGQRASYLALREIAESVTDGRWLALGGGGYSPVRVVPRAWTHLLAIVAGREIDPATPLPDDWLALAAAARPEVPLPIDMSDGIWQPVTFERWDGTVELPVDRAIQDTRSAVYPLHGLDAHDPRD
ncbi:MAG TPA: acetoin utilization protein AcuC [Nakamurella sp.]|nr:acetoin utilization protein AcuC [Nakamurella sp.]